MLCIHNNNSSNDERCFKLAKGSYAYTARRKRLSSKVYRVFLWSRPVSFRYPEIKATEVKFNLTFVAFNSGQITNETGGIQREIHCIVAGFSLDPTELVTQDHDKSHLFFPTGFMDNNTNVYDLRTHVIRYA